MVATWNPHLRLTYGGTLGDAPPTEVWSNTVKWHCQGFEPGRAQLLAGAQAAAVPLAAWFSGSAAKIHRSAHLNFVKLNWVQASGKQRDTDTVLFDISPATNGGSNTQTPPFYQSFAVTLRTSQKRGRAHAGRVFPPMVVLDNPDAGTPYASTTAVGGMATAYVVMLRAVRTALATAFAVPGGGVPDPAVHSAGDSVTGVAPLWLPITAAVVDRVPDVQHRRTKQIPRSEGLTVLLDP
jgi:hypothetical protein